MTWLAGAELRVGLGCMRLGEHADATITAAVDSGITVFDTARSYGDNERLLAAVLRRAGAAGRARIVTKGGMSRVGSAWVPDGRARTIRSDCEASLQALGGLPVDLYLIHAPDPRTPWKTSLRALARLADEGLVRRVGVSNVHRPQLEEALELAPITAVQVALSVLDDSPLRGGVVELCHERGIALIAHSPLGGPRRAASVARREQLSAIGAAHDASPAEVALAWLLALAPEVVAIPGARRPETARSSARAATLTLDEAELEAIAPARRPVRRARPKADGEVVVVMGIPGAGKGRIAAEYVERGYLRLNRDERGGTLKELAAALAAGTRRVVLDNTYLTRASRSYVLEVAAAHRLGARCVWLDTPLAQAQVNLVERLLDRFGALPSPDELKRHARSEPGLLLPTSQMRAARELEPPATGEGWTSVEQRAFSRAPRSGRPGVFVAAAALTAPAGRDALATADPSAPRLVFDWRPGGTPDELANAVAGLPGEVETAVCPHPGGPPACWCRPPLPGLPLAFARAHGVDPSRSLVVGTGPAHRTLATALGAVAVLV